MADRAELTTLKNLLSQADHILETTPPLPENRTGATRELLATALALTDDLLKQAKLPAAATLGHKGISTSFVERQNLTMRMAIRPFTRLTNAFSKKLLNLKMAVALHFAYYNSVASTDRSALPRRWKRV